MTFVHLNCRSDRSIGYGMIKPEQLAAHYKSIGATAACITDTNLNAAVQLNKGCQKHGIMPVFGMEVSVAPDKAAKKQGSEALVLLAMNKTGFYNLVKLATIGAMYFYYMPRVDLETLKEHSEGLIALTGDMRGVAASAYFRRQEMGLEEVCETYSEIFPDRFYFEIQPVPTDTQRVFNEAVIDYVDVTPSAKIVATGSPHYLRPEHAELHKTLMKARNFRNIEWTYPFKGPYHVRTFEELVAEFSELHGFEIAPGTAIWQALEEPARVLEMVEQFDLREGVKVPSYLG